MQDFGAMSEKLTGLGGLEIGDLFQFDFRIMEYKNYEIKISGIASRSCKIVYH